jgi:hypothetical protein
MSAERRCQWCGKPSAPDFAKGCEEHKGIMRAIAARNNKALYERRMKLGLCVYCGKRPSRFGFTTCGFCSHKKALKVKEWREDISVKRFDHRLDKDLLTVAEASDIIGIDRSGIHRLIKVDILSIFECYPSKKIWLSGQRVRRYAREREARKLNLVRCLRCGHIWSPRPDTKNPRCSGCYGRRIEKLTPTSDGHLQIRNN